MDRDLERLVPLDAVTERGECVTHRADVVARVEGAQIDPRTAVGDRGQDELAVPDALGGGHADAYVAQRVTEWDDRTGRHGTGDYGHGSDESAFVTPSAGGHR